jgi:hypothetical protein
VCLKGTEEVWFSRNGQCGSCILIVSASTDIVIITNTFEVGIVEEWETVEDDVV